MPAKRKQPRVPPMPADVMVTRIRRPSLADALDPWERGKLVDAREALLDARGSIQEFVFSHGRKGPLGVFAAAAWEDVDEVLRFFHVVLFDPAPVPPRAGGGRAPRKRAKKPS